mgnify:CR=1 FL=1
MKTIIVGYGEVGKALAKVLEQYKPEIIDPQMGLHSASVNCDILHITFPFSDKFVEQVEEYKLNHTPKYVVIHSTVPVGTCQELGAISSPIRGLHPNLEGGIRTFVKFIGGEQASEVADYFRKAGLRVILFDKAETAEAFKLYDTTYYKVCIDFAHRVKKFCEENDLNFHEVYSLPNQTYNEGYTQLGYPEYIRPVLQPIKGPIKGHCVLPNEAIIKSQETK